jgi:hypothetical protein
MFISRPQTQRAAAVGSSAVLGHKTSNLSNQRPPKISAENLNANSCSPASESAKLNLLKSAAKLPLCKIESQSISASKSLNANLWPNDPKLSHADGRVAPLSQ